MEHIMVQVMLEITALSELEKQDIRDSFPIKMFEKNSLLLREGQIANVGYFVIEGVIREYQILDGIEKTTAFYTELQTATDFLSQSTQTPTSKYFQCVEDSKVASFSRESELRLYRKHPRFETYCREGMETMMGQQQEALSKFIVSSPSERYLALLAERPDLINRVPQYQIASYLGVKPETLSRIRRKLANEGSY